MLESAAGFARLAPRCVGMKRPVGCEEALDKSGRGAVDAAGEVY